MCSTVPVDQDIYILLVVMLSTCTVCTCRQCLHTCAPAAPAMLLLRTWCLQRIDGGKIEDQCNALLEPDLERVFGQNLVNKRQLTPQHPHWAAGFHGKILFPVWPDRLPGLDPEEAQWHFAHWAQVLLSSSREGFVTLEQSQLPEMTAMYWSLFNRVFEYQLIHCY